MAKDKPLMLLDVDGPLNPYAAKPTKRPDGYKTHRMTPTGWENNPLRVWLNPNIGEKLISLGYEIIWCTAWAHDANIWISPHVGLPTDLETIEWGPHDVSFSNIPDKKLFWKAPQVVTWIQNNYPDTPFIWVDDEAGDREEKFLDDNLDNKFKIFRISPKDGITDSDLGSMSEWKAKLDG